MRVPPLRRCATPVGMTARSRSVSGLEVADEFFEVLSEGLDGLVEFEELAFLEIDLVILEIGADGLADLEGGADAFAGQ